MPILATIFWVLGFILSVVIAPQLRIWSWGPSLLCFVIATLATLPVMWREGKNTADSTTVYLGALLVGWIGIRAWTSPVEELAQSDLLLLAMAVATFVTFRVALQSLTAQRIILYGMAGMMVASLFVLGRQVVEPGYSPLFPNTDTARFPSGFFAHYSYGASFLIPVSLLLAGFAMQSQEKWPLRVSLGIFAVLGAVGVYFTQSRGGVVGMATGIGMLFFFSILIGKRERKKWFGPAVIALPVVMIGAVVFFLMTLSDVQQARGGQGEMDDMLDNPIRLYLLGIAFSCILLHPFIGGGSRSFSWECFQFWDQDSMGRGAHKPEHVHNEFIQALTDYGIIGGVLLLLFISSVVVIALARFVAKSKGTPTEFADAWRVGGLAGFAGLFAQSNFEGIFRLPTGAILLGLCLAASSAGIVFRSRNENRVWLRSSVATLIALAAIGVMIIPGWRGTLISRALWPTYFSEVVVGHETQADAVTSALNIWSLGSLYQHRAMLFQEWAAGEASPGNRRELMERAAQDYISAYERHRFDPTNTIAAGILLSFLDRDEEAEALFTKSAELQGGMEPAFEAHYHYAEHLYRKGLNEIDQERPVDAVSTLEISAKKITLAAKLDPWQYSGGNREGNLPINIHGAHGKALEIAGEPRKALETYEFVSTLRGGSSAHYRAGVLLGRLAVKAWSERRGADALRLFIDARHRVGLAAELPEEVTPEARSKYIAYLDHTIQYLQGAKFEPSEKVEF